MTISDSNEQETRNKRISQRRQTSDRRTYARFKDILGRRSGVERRVAAGSEPLNAGGQQTH